MGVSIESNEVAWRADFLRKVPAAVRFISAEPLLGPVSIEEYLEEQTDAQYVPHDYDGERRAFGDHEAPFCGLCGNRKPHAIHHGMFEGVEIPNGGKITTLTPALDWVIVGGESGPRHRPMDHAWTRAIRDQCVAGGVAYWGKQDAGPRAAIALPDDGGLSDREWPRP